MAGQTSELLRNVRAIGEVNDLFHQAVLLDLHIRNPGALDAFDQLVAITLLHLGRLLLHPRQRLPHHRNAF